MRTRRDLSGFSLSFLDCICCAFGAIILLLVISKFSELVVLVEARADLEAVVAELDERVAQRRTDAGAIERELAAVRDELTRGKERMARLRSELTALRARLVEADSDAAVQRTIAQRLQTARQALTEEMKRLLGRRHRRAPSDSTIGGIPVDSEYVIFVIDTSGSMQEYAWRSVMEKVGEALKIYPTLKGIQVLNDMGDYMFSQYRGRWIPDSRSRRQAIVKRLRSWRPFSNSSPVEGIEKAIRTFYARDKKISIFVFGDEFSGGSIDAVAQEVDRLNRAGRGAARRVRIHAVGFPTQFQRPLPLQVTGIRFATLMRVLAERNGGSFVGLRRARP